MTLRIELYFNLTFTIVIIIASAASHVRAHNRKCVVVFATELTPQLQLILIIIINNAGKTYSSCTNEYCMQGTVYACRVQYVQGNLCRETLDGDKLVCRAQCKGVLVPPCSATQLWCRVKYLFHGVYAPIYCALKFILYSQRAFGVKPADS